MKRREFVAGLGSVMAWPVMAEAQQSDGTRRVGVLMGFSETDAQAQTYMAAFREGLRKLVGQKTATSKSKPVGRRTLTPMQGGTLQRNSWRCGQTSSFRIQHQPQPHC